MNSIEDDRTYPMQEGEEGGQAPQNRNVSLRNLVLQCAHCKMIVGDTTHLVCTACVEGVNVVVLKAATEVVVDTEPRQDDDGDEMNDRSTFFNVKCASCNTAIGRMYAKTPAGLDNLRNMFSFEVAKCKSYRMGSADIMVAESQDMEESFDPLPTSQKSPAPSNDAIELQTRVSMLESELIKMQGMILLHDKQLQNLPGYYNDSRTTGE